MSITANDILQANAVVIAGLLILLSIQSLGTPQIDELGLEYNNLLSLFTRTNQTLNANYERMTASFNDLLQNPNDLGKKLVYEQAIKDLETDKNTFNQIKIRLIELETKLNVLSNIDQFEIFFVNPKFLISILLMPFVFSASITILHSYSKNEEKPGKISLAFFIGGLFFVLLSITVSNLITVTNIPNL